MSLVDEAEHLRHALAIAERTGPGRAYPAAIRAQTVAYLKLRLAMGIGEHAVARELGVALTTLVRWSREQSAPRFHAVALVPSPVTRVVDARPVVVHGPAGLRIEGLDLDSVVALWRRLS